MSITQEEWDYIKPRLIKGCTWTHTATNKRSSPQIGTYYNRPGSVPNTNTFTHKEWNPFFSLIKNMNPSILEEISNFKYPDGTDMLSQEPQKPGYNKAVIFKIKQLEQKYNNRNLFAQANPGGTYALLCL